MSVFHTTILRDKDGMEVSRSTAPANMRQHRQNKREEAEARQQQAILAAHPNGKCDCGRRKTVDSHRQKGRR